MDATLSETNVWRSVKKFWIDHFSEIPVFFDNLVVSADQPDADRWIVIKVENISPGHVSIANMNVFMFSRKDSEGDDLANLRDSVIDVLFPGYIDLYNTSESTWTKVGAMLVRDISQSGNIPSPGDTKMRYIESTLKWGAVWS